MPNKNKKVEQELTFFLSNTLKIVRKNGLKGLSRINTIIIQNQEEYLLVDFIIKTVCSHLQIKPEDCFDYYARGVPVFARKLIVLFWKEYSSLSKIELGRMLNRTRRVIYNDVAEIEKLSRNNKLDKEYFEKYDEINPIIENYINKNIAQ